MNKGTRYGLIGGAVFGAVFGAFYALASWLVCNGARSACGGPGHWAPYLIVALIAFGVCVALGGFAGTVIVWFYRLTKV